MTYIGIEFWQATPSNAIDATGLTALHCDVWSATGTSFGLKLVDFGGMPPGSVLQTQGEIDFDASSTPAFTPGGWVALDVPLSTFQAAGLTATPSDLSQLLLANGGGATFYVENLYLH